jgi:acetoin utilization protein AcuB
MRVVEIMKKKVETVAPEASSEEAWNRMQMRKVHHLVVARGSEVIGVVSDRDLGGMRGATYRVGRDVADVMTPSVVTARPDTTLREAANLLRGRTIGCLPVLEKEKLVGIVTTSDLLVLLGKGAERPVAKSKRWILKGRGPRRKSVGRG